MVLDIESNFLHFVLFMRSFRNKFTKMNFNYSKDLNPGMLGRDSLGFSPAEFSINDGEIISNAIKKAVKNPVELEYDERKYRRKTKTYESKIGLVTVPEDHDEDPKKGSPR